jgi:glycosyltransferase involved in cell wall biosynthesis
MRVGQELVRRGVEVLVLAPEPVAPHPEAPEVAVRGFWSPTPLAGVAQMLAGIEAFGARDVLVQYVPHMLAATRFGSPAIAILLAWLRGRSIRATAIAHELWLDWSRRPDLTIASLTLRVQFATVLLLAERVVVSTETRRRLALPLAGALGRAAVLDVVPIGSNAVPVVACSRPGTFRLGLFSTLAGGKRFDLVLSAFALIARKVPEAELVLVGHLGTPGQQRYDALRAQVRAHPAAARIRITGKLPLPEVAAAVASLDVYLFPMDTGATTRSCTLPLPLGAGVPVVAVKGSETDGFFVADENIVFATGLTAEGLAAAALRLRDEALASRVREGGRALYDERLTWEKIASAILPDAREGLGE